MNKLSNRRKKSGLTWVNGRTGQLRYSHDEKNPINYVQPLEVYKAAEKIRRGEAVSIASEEDLTLLKTALGDQFDPSETYLVRTDTNKHVRSLGLALEPGNPGDEIHIQNIGKFTFETDADTEKEYIPSFTEKDIGKLVYVKGTSSINERGKLTISSEESWKNYKNIIKIGYLTDVPLNESAQKEICISLGLEGDTRGLIDATQFELVVGEKFKISKEDQIRVFALGQEEDEKASVKMTLNFDKNTTIDSQAFVAVSRMDGKTHFLLFNSDLVPDAEVTASVTDRDSACINLAKKWIGVGNSPSKTNLGINDLADFNVESLTTLLKEKISEAFISVAEDNTLTSNTTLSNSSGSSTEFKAEKVGGYYFFYVSENLRKLLKLETLSNGSFFNKGRAVLADIRIKARNNVVGFYYSGEFGREYNIGDSALFLKNGVFETTNDNNYPLKTGETYYLGENGCLDREDFLHTELDSVVKLGYAETEHRLICSIDNVRTYEVGSLPIGYMKPAVNFGGNFKAEHGFLLTDGKTVLRKDSYLELYRRIKRYFSSDQLSETPTTFILPKIVYKIDGEEVVGEIKYLGEGIFEERPVLPVKRFYGKFSDDISKPCEILRDSNGDELEITDLLTYGPMESSVDTINFDNLEIKLSVDLENNYGTPNPVTWTEIEKGVYPYNNDTTYGFRWKIKKISSTVAGKLYDRYFLQTDICSQNGVTGQGVSFIKTPHEAPIKLSKLHWKVFVARRETYSRQFNLDTLIKNFTSLHVLNLEGKPVLSPVTGSAVEEYLREFFTSAEKLILTKTLGVGTKTQAGSLELFLNDKSFIKTEAGTQIRFFNSLEAEEEDEVVLTYQNGKFSIGKKIILTNTQYEDFKRYFEEYDLIPKKLLTHHEESEVTKSNTVHGMRMGREGTIDAATVDGLKVKKAETEILQELKSTDKNFIPYVDNDFVFSIGNKIELFTPVNSGGTEVAEKTGQIEFNTGSNSSIKQTFHSKNSRSGLYYLFELLAQDKNPVGQGLGIYLNFNPTLNSTSGLTEVDLIKQANNFVFLKGTEHLATVAAADFKQASSKAFKYPKKTEDSNFTKIPEQALNTIAALDFYEYRSISEVQLYGSSAPVKLGILIEALQESVQPGNLQNKIIFTDFESDSESTYKYHYTQNEKDTIAELADELLDSSKKALNQGSIAGLMLQALKETQLRLLRLESSVEGVDAKYRPGEKPDVPALADKINQNPLFLGLNRVVRALAREVFDDENPLDGQFDSSISESLKNDNKLSRLDRIDTEINGAKTENSGKKAIKLIKTKGTSYPKEINQSPLEREKLYYKGITDPKITSATFSVVNQSLSLGLESLEPQAVFFETEKINGRLYLRMTCKVKGASIHWTDNTTDPTKDSALYTTPILLETDKVFKATALQEKFQDNPESGLKNSNFDGLNDAFNRAITKIDQLTLSINGKNNINSRPSRLDVIRENIENLITELVGSHTYRDEDNNYQPYQFTSSRLGTFTEDLYLFKFPHNPFFKNSLQKEFGDKKRKINLRIKPSITDSQIYLLTSDTPTVEELNNTATSIDLIIDLVGADQLIRNTKTNSSRESKRLIKTLTERIYTLERALDAVVEKVVNYNTFEAVIEDTTEFLNWQDWENLNIENSAKDNPKLRTELLSIEDFCRKILDWCGLERIIWKEVSDMADIQVGDKYCHLKNDTTDKYYTLSWTIDSYTIIQESTNPLMYRVKELTQDTEIADCLTSQTKLHGVVERLHFITSQHTTQLTELKTQVGDEYYGKSSQALVWKDLVNLLKTVYGTDINGNKTAINHQTETGGEEFASNNLLNYLTTLLYSTPKLIKAVKTSGDELPYNIFNLEKATNSTYETEDSSPSIYFDVDSAEKTSAGNPISEGHRGYYFDEIGSSRLVGSDKSKAKKSRLEILEEQIRALRQFIGLDKLKETTPGLGSDQVTEAFLNMKYKGKFIGPYSFPNSSKPEEVTNIPFFELSSTTEQDNIRRNTYDSLLSYIQALINKINQLEEMFSAKDVEGIAGFVEKFQSVLNDLKSLKGNIESFQTHLNSQATRITQLDTKVGEFNSKTTKLESTVEDLSKAFATNQQTVNHLHTKVSEKADSSAVTTLTSDLKSFENKLEEVIPSALYKKDFSSIFDLRISEETFTCDLKNSVEISNHKVFFSIDKEFNLNALNLANHLSDSTSSSDSWDKLLEVKLVDTKTYKVTGSWLIKVRFTKQSQNSWSLQLLSL